jgi:hypothetical protein
MTPNETGPATTGRADSQQDKTAAAEQRVCTEPTAATGPSAVDAERDRERLFRIDQACWRRRSHAALRLPPLGDGRRDSNVNWVWPFVPGGE